MPRSEAAGVTRDRHDAGVTAPVGAGPAGGASAGAGLAGAASAGAGPATEEDVRRQTQGAFSGGIVMVASKVVAWVLAFAMTIMVPRYLGAAGFGRLYIAMTLTGIMTILVEFGVNNLVARQVSRKRHDATRYLVNAGLIKAGLWVVAAAILAVVVKLLGYTAQTSLATAILAVGVLIACEATLVVAVLQGYDRMRWIAISAVTEKIVYMILGVTVLLMGFGVLAVATVMVVGSTAGFLLDLWWLRKVARHHDMHSGYQGLELRSLLMRALPFFSALFFGAIYFHVDVLILSVFSTDKEVGYYGAAYRLFQTTYILPDAFLFALFPLLCRLATQHARAIAMAATKSLDVLVLIGVPLSAMMAVLAGPIITTLYGAPFDPCIPLLRILALAVALMYVDGVFVQMLMATERQKRLSVTAIAAALFNTGLNFALIPHLGPMGAAITTVATEVLVIIMNFSFLAGDVRAGLRFHTLWKALVAAAVMGAVLTLLIGQSLLLLIPLGTAVYVAAIVVLRAISPEDWKLIVSAFGGVRST